MTERTGYSKIGSVGGRMSKKQIRNILESKEQEIKDFIQQNGRKGSVTKRIVIPSPNIKKQKIKDKKLAKKNRTSARLEYCQDARIYIPENKALEVLINKRRQSLAKSLTPAETYVSNALAENKITFQMEKPFVMDWKNEYFCFADIYIPQYNIVIEVDGKYHNDEKQKWRDSQKDAFYKSQKIKVLRITNSAAQTRSKNELVELIKKLADNNIKHLHLEKPLTQDEKEANEKERLHKLYKEFKKELTPSSIM